MSESETPEEKKARHQRCGRMGGQATAAKYGPEYFSQIGKKGGDTLKAERGLQYFEEIGRMRRGRNR
jgi:general stress protein YciG